MQIQSLSGEDQFYCDQCASLQDATVSTYVSHVSKIVTLHLKRFRWEDDRGHVKVAGKVKFPLHLAAADINRHIDAPCTLYELFAVLVHIGS